MPSLGRDSNPLTPAPLPRVQGRGDGATSEDTASTNSNDGVRHEVEDQRGYIPALALGLDRKKRQRDGKKDSCHPVVPLWLARGSPLNHLCVTALAGWKSHPSA